MVWTAPQTWTTSQVVTAADMNGDVRDNMLETAAATAAAAGDIVYADAANSMGSRVAHPGAGRMLVSDTSNGLVWRQPVEDVNYADGSSSDTLPNTTYTAATENSSFPSVTVTTGTQAVVFIFARAVGNDTLGANTRIAYSVSGSTTRGASDDFAVVFESDPANQLGPLCAPKLETGLTAGSNTFQVEGRVTAGTSTIFNPRILVIPL